MGRILRAIKKRLPLGSLQRRDFEREDDGQAVENDDAWAQVSGAQYPPGYVKDDDEDRPPH